MSYTLRGRLELRLLAALPTLLAMAALVLVLRHWWPIQLVACMLAVGVAFDVIALGPLLAYQPAWAAVPVGLVELAAVTWAVRALGVAAPMRVAVAVFAVSWLVGQVLAQVLLPLRQPSYAEDGGELGPPGRALALGVVLGLAGLGGVADATQPPTLRLGAGSHRGPIVIDRAERLVGDPGAVVTGGIVIRHDDVEVRGLTVAGAGLDYGIDVEGATDVRLVGVRVAGAALDQIHVRRSSVSIRDCTVESGSGYTQGIDISYGADLPVSEVARCHVSGGQEGIVSHFANVSIHGNDVRRTALRAITVTEMSMGMVERNDVHDVLGVGLFCGDHSECQIELNRVARVSADAGSGDLTRRGYGILAHYGATATVRDNAVVASPGGIGALYDGRLDRG